MNISTQLYKVYIEQLPKRGQHILAHQTTDQIVFYQAYKRNIADFAVENQYLGGPEYGYNRMSWIKPNFLWMMYRCGWAEKENQECVLALWINKTDFEKILNEAVVSSFNKKYHDSSEVWKNDLNSKEVRLQWDPDHDPYGHKEERRAIQLGLKGQILEEFGKRYIKHIEDVTEFVAQQKYLLDDGRVDELLVPVETIFKPSDKSLYDRIGIDDLISQ